MAQERPRTHWRAFCSVFVDRKMMARNGNLHRWHQNGPRKKLAGILFCCYGQKNNDGNLHRWQNNPRKTIGGHSVLFAWSGNCSVFMVRTMMAKDSNLQRWHQNSPRTNWRAFCSVFVVRTMIAQDGNLQNYTKTAPEKLACILFCFYGQKTMAQDGNGQNNDAPRW